MSFAKAQKRQREKARQEKAAIKRQRRLERGDGSSDESSDEAERDAPAEGDVLAELAALHVSFEAEEIPFEEFEERKQELLARLAV